MSTERPEGSVDPKLLEILVCPLTKSPLEYDAARQELVSRKAKLAFPIRDGGRGAAAGLVKQSNDKQKTRMGRKCE